MIRFLDLRCRWFCVCFLIMDNQLKIASVNVRGLGNSQKRRDVFNYLRDLNASLYLLQDTHFIPENEFMIKNEWGLEAIFASFSSNSRGVAILFNNNITL